MSSKRQRRLEAGTSGSDNSNDGSPGSHAEAHNITGLPDVPEGCFRKIVLFVGDAAALHLCGANKKFQDLQPEPKMLAIDPPHHSSSDYPRWIHWHLGMKMALKTSSVSLSTPQPEVVELSMPSCIRL